MKCSKNPNFAPNLLQANTDNKKKPTVNNVDEFRVHNLAQLIGHQESSLRRDIVPSVPFGTTQRCDQAAEFQDLKENTVIHLVIKVMLEIYLLGQPFVPGKETKSSRYPIQSKLAHNVRSGHRRHFDEPLNLKILNT